MNNYMKDGRTGFNDMNERDKDTQAAIWSLMLLLGEMALALRVLRDKLKINGALEEGDEEILNTAISNESNLRGAYAHIENIFLDKFSRVKQALENPEEVTSAVQNQDIQYRADVDAQVTEDIPHLNTLPDKKGDD